MKKSDKINLRQKSVSQLTKTLADIQKQLVEVKIKHAAGNQKDTSVIGKLKTQIAFIKTIITQSK